MRFHFGVSVRPKNIIKWVLLALFGLLAFLGIGGIKDAKALTYNLNGTVAPCGSSNYWSCGTSWTITTQGTSSKPANSPLYNYLNITYYSFGTFNMTKGESYSFVFNVNSTSSVPVTGEVASLAQFRINLQGGAVWYLENVSCVVDTFNTGRITCLVIPQNDYSNVNYVRLSLMKDNAGWVGLSSVTSQFSIESDATYYNALNQINNTINNQTNAINNVTNAINDGFDDLSGKIIDQSNITSDIYDELTDNSEPDSDISSLSGVSSILPAGPVDSLLAIPVTFLNKTITALGGTCSPFTFTFVFDEEMTLPCFEDLYADFPASLKIFCDTIPAGFLLIAYFKHLYKKVDRATSLNADSNDDWGVI